MKIQTRKIKQRMKMRKRTVMRKKKRTKKEIKKVIGTKLMSVSTDCLERD